MWRGASRSQCLRYRSSRFSRWSASRSLLATASRNRPVNERASHARSATQLCRRRLGGALSRALIRVYRVGAIRDVAAMAHLVDRHFVQRANTALMLSILWGGLAACVIGALAYD